MWPFSGKSRHEIASTKVLAPKGACPLAKVDKGPVLVILMANYNNREFVGTAIESVLKQTDPRWRLLICDDGSTDNSWRVIERYRHDPRVTIFKNEKNLGYPKTLVRLIEKAPCDILGILDSDDSLTPDAVASILQAYRDHPECGFIYSQFQFMGPNGGLGPVGFNKRHDRTCLGKMVTHFKTFKKSEYLRTAGIDVDLVYAEDRDLVYIMEEVTKFLFLDKVLYFYRKNPHGLMSRKDYVAVSYFNHVRAIYHAYMRRKEKGILLDNMSPREFRSLVDGYSALVIRAILVVKKEGK